MVEVAPVEVSVGVVPGMLTLNGVNPGMRAGSLSVPYQRIVSLRDPSGNEHRDEGYFDETARLPTWLAKPPEPVEHPLQVTTGLARDIAGILHNRSLANAGRALLKGSGVVLEELEGSVSLSPRRDVLRIGEWVAHAARAGGKFYRFSRLTGLGDGGDDGKFLQYVVDGAFGVFKEQDRSGIHQIFAHRLSAVLNARGHGVGAAAPGRNIGFFRVDAGT